MLQKIFLIKLKTLHTANLQHEQRDFLLYQVLDFNKRRTIRSQLNKMDLKRVDCLFSQRFFVCVKSAVTRDFYDKDNVKNVISSGKFEKLKAMLEEIIAENTAFFYSANLLIC